MTRGVGVCVCVCGIVWSKLASHCWLALRSGCHYTHTHMYIHTHTLTYIYKIYMYIYVNIYMCIYIYTYIYIYTQTPAHTYIHIYIYIYAYIHLHIFIHQSWRQIDGSLYTVAVILANTPLPHPPSPNKYTNNKNASASHKCTHIYIQAHVFTYI